MIDSKDSPTAKFDARISKICMVIARLILAYMFFCQTFWKLPPTFGCGGSYVFPKPSTTAAYDVNNSGGLCFYMGLESISASKPRQVLIADMRPAGWPTIGVDISPIAKINGYLLDNLFIPQIRIFGWLVYLLEFWVFVSLALGLFTRLGALAAIGISFQLYVGLANVGSEWEWTYGILLALAIVMLGAAAGRTFGLDGWLRPRLAGPAGRGNRIAQFLLLLG